MNASEPTLDQFNARYSWRQILSFGALFIAETFTGRKLSRLMQCQIGKPEVEVCGEENVPNNGAFTLAVNHFKNGQSLAVVSAVIASASKKRPELKDNYLLVVGQRVSARAAAHPFLSAVSRRIARWIRDRWAKNLLQIPIGNDRPSIDYLRHWRRRVRHQPCILFPEGKADMQFDAVRDGCGRWLASFDVPTIPVGVWWRDDEWHVRFGKSIEWTRRSELRDLQLGLSIASLLPVEIASDWQEDLTRWRAAHE